MNEYLQVALERLEKEFEDGKKLNKYSNVMAEPVKKQLVAFCEQEPEFAQAVVQGGNFKDCMAAVTKGVGSSLSDIEAYERAVRFYFPGSRIRFQLTVDLVGDAEARPIAAQPGLEPTARQKQAGEASGILPRAAKEPAASAANGSVTARPAEIVLSLADFL